MVIKVLNYEYDELKTLIKKTVGVDLGDNKQYLIESRFAPIMKEININSFSDLLYTLKYKDSGNVLMEKIIDAITTHETLFFRDKNPYQSLGVVLKNYFKKGYVKIWSAAVSTGQEAYSIAITIEELNRLLPESAKLQYEIIGTDISQDVLDYAKKGEYKSYEIARGMPADYLKKYFNIENNLYQVVPQLKKFISYKKFNLIQNYYNLGQFDIVFCRNVLIYFDDVTKKLVYKNIYNSLNKDGYLFIGSAESMLNYSTDFTKETVEQNFVYKPK